ncbi:MAG: glutaminase A [Bacillota bacterium]
MPFEEQAKQEILNKQLHSWVDQCKSYTSQGKVASYIPALARAEQKDLGISIIGLNGLHLSAGDFKAPFTLQSISKIFGLIVALEVHGSDYVFTRVGAEPTGDPFNSIARLETVQADKPFNPLINSGAITVCSLLPGSSSEEKLESIMKLLENILGRQPVINEEVYLSEMETGDRNRSLGYFLKDAGMIEGDVEETLTLYFKMCAIEVNCLDLSLIGVTLANNGSHPDSKEQLISTQVCRIIKTLMFTCGMYNASGKYAVQVGIPSKSGVSGGILAVASGNKLSPMPFGCGIGVYGPALDEYGNSIAGVELLKYVSEEWNAHVF